MTGIIQLPADPNGRDATQPRCGDRAEELQALYVPENAIFDVQGRLLTQTFTACVLQADVDEPILGNTFMDVPFADGPGGKAGRCEVVMAGAQAAEMIAVDSSANDRDGRLPDAPFVPLRPWDVIRDVSDAVQ